MIEYEKILLLLGYSPEYVKLFIEEMNRTGFNWIPLAFILSIPISLFICSQFSWTIQNCFVKKRTNIIPFLFIPIPILLGISLFFNPLGLPLPKMKQMPEHNNDVMEFTMIERFKDNPDWINNASLNKESKRLLVFCLSPKIEFRNENSKTAIRLYEYTSGRHDTQVIECLADKELPIYLASKSLVKTND